MYFIPTAGRHESRNRHDDKATAEIEASILARVYRRPASVIAVGSRGEKRLRVPRARLARRNGAELSERALVAKMLDRDNAAWMDFMQRYDKLITVAVMKSHNVRRESDSVSEIKARFYEALIANDMNKLRTWDPDYGTKLGTWIHRLAANAGVDYTRRAKVRPTVSIEGGRGGDDDSPSYGDRAEDRGPTTFDRLASARELASVIGTLTPLERKIVDLRFEEGLSSIETGRELGITNGMVDVTVSRLRARFRKAMAD